MKNRPIHIQHVLLSLEPGGLENGVVNVVNRLDPQRFRSSICCLRRVGEFASRITNPAVEVLDFRSSGGTDVRTMLALARHFRRSATDVVHTRNAEAYFHGFVGAKLAGLPIVHSEHGRTFDDRASRLRAQRVLSSHTNAIFSVSKQLRGDLVQWVGLRADDIEVLYNGVDLDRFAVRRDRQALRAAHGLETEGLVVGSVGRLVALKNYALLLHAVACAELAGLTVVLVGDGPERPALEGLAATLGIAHRVRFLGQRADIAELLATFDVFVLPSVSEGLSNTLLEAMAAGVAVLVSDVGGNPEIVHDGVHGLVFPSGDERALRDRLRALCFDEGLRDRYVGAARARLVAAFGMDSMVQRYEALYERLARASRV